VVALGMAIIVGMLVYLLTKRNPEAREIGRCVMLAGFVGPAIAYASRFVHL